MVRARISFTWQPLGLIHRDGADRLVFPKAGSQPGLYRFDICGPENNSVYIGETDRLNRRFQHYRTPGSSQQTNKRLNALMREVLRTGGTISIAIVDAKTTLNIDGREQRSDFLAKDERLRLENAALFEARESGATVLNR